MPQFHATGTVSDPAKLVRLLTFDLTPIYEI